MIVPALLLLSFQSRTLYLGDPANLATRSVLVINDARLEPAKLSPRKFGDMAKPWEFDWVCAGLGRPNPQKSRDYDLRFRVFSQLRKEKDDLGILTTRMLMRLWEYSIRTFKVDHADRYMKVVDFYLCWGGEPGAQQAFGEDPRPGAKVARRISGEQINDFDVEGNPPTRRAVNTVYVFDIGNLPSRSEMAREICHEYGHALMPPIGGFGPPEDWGNGDIGERIFMRYLRDQLVAKKLNSIDALNADVKEMDAWVKKYVDPGVLRVAKNGPMTALIDGKGADSVSALAGLASYVEAVMPPEVFVRSLQICGPKAKNYPNAVLEACKIVERVVLEIPPLLAGKNLWIPWGNAKISGATVVKKQGNWALINPGFGAIMVTYGK